MKFPAKGGVDFEIVPAGNHVAICNAIVDLGMQRGSVMYPAPKHKVYIRFELPNEMVKYVKDGREMSGPMSIGSRFTASMSTKANLRKFIESWFGKAFPTDDAAADLDLSALLGRKCLLNVTHNDKGDKTYANISNATPIPKGMQADFQQQNASIYFNLLEPDNGAFERLPEWLQKIIHERLGDRPDEKETATNGTNGSPPPADYDDDIPF